jgi:hypothetical protein
MRLVGALESIAVEIVDEKGKVFMKKDSISKMARSLGYMGGKYLTNPLATGRSFEPPLYKGKKFTIREQVHKPSGTSV